MDIKQRAKLVAEHQHLGQTYDIYPYIFHVTQVALVAERLGFDETIVVACYLHDIMEDGNLSYNDIKIAFGEEVAEIVFSVTDELGRSRQERKEKTYSKISSNWKATAVKLCDRIANIQHAKDYNRDKYKMYVKEHAEFKHNIFSPRHPKGALDDAWAMLDTEIRLSHSHNGA